MNESLALIDIQMFMRESMSDSGATTIYLIVYSAFRCAASVHKR